MSKVEYLERQIQQLSPEELAEFRRWCAEFDADLWDR
jgi:succinate dehydrogenase flavin-adding protein (antitoxin of CptAB toxin-antitoxin module)